MITTDDNNDAVTDAAVVTVVEVEEGGEGGVEIKRQLLLYQLFYRPSSSLLLLFIIEGAVSRTSYAPRFPLHILHALASKKKQQKHGTSVFCWLNLIEKVANVSLSFPQIYPTQKFHCC